MKYIYIDESYFENDRYFVLAALKTDCSEVLETAIRETRKLITENNRNIKTKKKKIMLQEIHEHEIHTRYPIVKKWVLERTFNKRVRKLRYTQYGLI